jgi:peptidyl-tRNA hydrolase ICT1
MSWRRTDQVRVNSKAQLRVPVSQLLGRLPIVLHPAIRQSRFYADKSDSLLLQADDSRKAATNKDSCYRKLSDLISEAYRATVPGETSTEQKEKVKGLKKSENESRLRTKKKLSSIKAGRSKSYKD